MRTIVRLGIIVGVCALLTSVCAAQSTNIVQHAYFVLTGLEQASNGVSVVRVTNKDLLAALNATGAYNFGSGAMVLLVSTDNQVPSVMVRQTNGTQVVTTDVGNNFGITELGDEVHTRNGATRWATWEFAFDNGRETDFQLWGFTTEYIRVIQTAGVGALQGLYGELSHVCGQGGIGGQNVVYYGAVYGGYPSLEEN